MNVTISINVSDSVDVGDSAGRRDAVRTLVHEPRKTWWVDFVTLSQFVLEVGCDRATRAGPAPSSSSKGDNSKATHLRTDAEVAFVLSGAAS